MQEQCFPDEGAGSSPAGLVKMRVRLSRSGVGPEIPGAAHATSPRTALRGSQASGLETRVELYSNVGSGFYKRIPERKQVSLQDYGK